MPQQGPSHDDDPIIASYPVYLAPSTHSSSLNSAADISPATSQKLFLLQYPAHRPAETPYNARNLQKPSSLRLKPSTGLLEVDVPIETKVNYNLQRGSAYATSLRRSRIAQEGGSHGLGGGFNTGAAGRNIREDEDIDMRTIPVYSDDSTLNVQTLGGKIVKRASGDPIYLLGSFHNNAFHLSLLDALVQVRPELHHLDAADELERNRSTPATARITKGKDAAVNGDILAGAQPAARQESKAIDIKLKSTGPSSFHDNDLSTNTNAKLLRAIQQEPWQTYEWVDEDEPESHDHAQKALHLPLNNNNDTKNLDTLPTSTTVLPTLLHPSITNSEYLDLMSAPRIEHGRKPGDKGLMGKVRGRERERQRRKKNEAARREKTTAGIATADGEVTGAGEPTTTAGEDEEEEGVIGPSDEESSEDEHGAGAGVGAGYGDVDVDMTTTNDVPTTVHADDEVTEVQTLLPSRATKSKYTPFTDGAADIIEVDRDDEVSAPVRKKGRPARKNVGKGKERGKRSAVEEGDAIVVDD